MKVRDRIKELRRVRAADLVPNAKNWRTHPVAQRDALRGVLADIGYADALLVRELSDGRLELIDGHLRAETTPDMLVPVLVLDVDEQQTRELVAACDFKSPQVVQMLDQLEQDIEKANQQFSELDERPEVAIPDSFQVVIECRDESEQQAMYERMRKEGYRCRVLTL